MRPAAACVPASFSDTIFADSRDTSRITRRPAFLSGIGYQGGLFWILEPVWKNLFAETLCGSSGKEILCGEQLLLKISLRKLSWKQW